jgi:hypothetical protein
VFLDESGGRLHAKFLNTQRAWDVYDPLADNYFEPNIALREFPLKSGSMGKDTHMLQFYEKLWLRRMRVLSPRRKLPNFSSFQHRTVSFRRSILNKPVTPAFQLSKSVTEDKRISEYNLTEGYPQYGYPLRN